MKKKKKKKKESVTRNHWKSPKVCFTWILLPKVKNCLILISRLGKHMLCRRARVNSNLKNLQQIHYFFTSTLFQKCFLFFGLCFYQINFFTIIILIKRPSLTNANLAGTRHQNDVKTLKQRTYNVILTSYAGWEIKKTEKMSYHRL